MWCFRNRAKALALAIAACSLFCVPKVVFPQAVPWASEIVQFDKNGKLEYLADDEQNRIPDFSYAGYRNSASPIPAVETVLHLGPIAGDNTTHIQNAIDQLAALPENENGFRGAIELAAGEYEIQSRLSIKTDGIVLRGAGDGEDSLSNTILKGTGNWPPQRTILTVGGGNETKWRGEIAGTRTNVVSAFVAVGARQFEVEDASGLRASDNIIIYHPCTEAWLEAIDHGGTHSDDPGAEPGVDLPWQTDSQPLVFNRFIEEVDGTTLTIDAPLFNHLDRSLSQSYLYKYDRQGLVTNVGVENLRIDMVTQGGSDENHAWNGIDLFQVEDAWVRDCTVLHFGQAAIRTNTATRITIENCKALDPVAQITGERMYNFQAYNASQQILFKKCHARNGRHHYVSNGTSWTSGVVFLDCTSEGAYAASEGHRRWSMGLLYDNHREFDGPRAGLNERLLGLYNRGYFGTSHGWSAAHSVAWNCDVAAGELHVQKPTTAQNYAIGCLGIVSGRRPPNSFAEPEGYIEGTNRPGLEPRSLFEAQLEERTGVSVAVAETKVTANTLPKRIFLVQNFPNPFNPVTRLKFELKESLNIKAEVYDVTGRFIDRLSEGLLAAGTHTIDFDTRGMGGKELTSGIYFFRLEAGGQIETTRMILLR